MGQVLADGGAWVPGRTIESHAPKPEQIRQPQDVVLYTRDLSFGYDFPLGEHIDLEFHSGEVTALTGRNGVGKSTLGLTLAGLLKPMAGRVCMADDLVPPHRENNVIHMEKPRLAGTYRHGVPRAGTPVRRIHRARRGGQSAPNPWAKPTRRRIPSPTGCWNA